MLTAQMGPDMLAVYVHLPLGHTPQPLANELRLDAPLPCPYLPVGQLVHDPRLLLAEYLPSGHVVHALLRLEVGLVDT